MNFITCTSARYVLFELGKTQHLSNPLVRLVSFHALPKYSDGWKLLENNHVMIRYHHSKSLLDASKFSSKFTKFSSHMSSRDFVSRSSSKREEKLRLQDAIPDGYELIYRAPMSMYALVGQGVSSLSLLLLMVVSSYKLSQGNIDFVSIPTKVGDIIENHEQIAILLVALLVLSFGFRRFASSYPIRIYHNDKSYISIFTGEFPWSSKRLKFKKGDVTHVEAQGILPWNSAKYRILKKKVFLLDNYFRVPLDLTMMMEPHDSSK